MKKSELLTLHDELQSLGGLKGVKFAYAISKNTAIIEREVKAINDSIKAPEKFIEYEEKRIALAQKYAKKDKDKNSITEVVDGIKKYVMEDQKTFDKEFAILRKEYKKVLDDRKKQITEYNSLLDSDIKLKFHKIKIAVVPEEITVGQMKTIQILLEDE